jgi:serine/threonine protein kinase
LDHVHSHHYFHRDLLPKNVLVTTTGLFTLSVALVTTSITSGTWREKDVMVIIKLADFGLARQPQRPSIHRVRCNTLVSRTGGPSVDSQLYECRRHVGNWNSHR